MVGGSDSYAICSRRPSARTSWSQSMAPRSAQQHHPVPSPARTVSRPKTLQLVRQVYFNRSGVLLLLAALSATLLTIWAITSPDAQRQVLLAISAGLFASTLYALLETGLTALRYEAVLQETVRAAVDDALSTAIELNTGHQREFLPTNIYPASMSPDPGFNRDVTHDLQQTARYIFRGATGRYTVARIANQPSVFESVVIMVADPRGANGLGPRIPHLVSFADPEDSYADVQTRLVDEIYETIVGARSAAAKCHRLEIALVDDPQVDRVELMDSAVYLTLYSETTAGTARFPKSLRFASSSSIWRIYSAQLERSVDSVALRFHVTPDTTDDELREILRRLGHAENDKAVIQRYESSFRTFASEFMREAA